MQTATITKPRSNWKHTLDKIAESATARRQRVKQAASEAEQQHEDTADSLPPQQEAVLTVSQLTEPAEPANGADAEWLRIQRRLHKILPPGVRPGLREERATWEAWHSVPNGYRSSTGQRMIRTVDTKRPPLGSSQPRPEKTREHAASRTPNTHCACSFD